MNAITYKEFFPLLKDNKVWIGPSISSGDRPFNVPDDYPLKAAGCGIDETGRKFIRVKGVRWFTNLDHWKRHQRLPLDLGFTYVGHENMYPMYDNYDAINVDKVSQIPCDFMGVMGVPITFLDKYCPDQFEILNCNDFRRCDSIPLKPSGLVKDKEAVITVGGAESREPRAESREPRAESREPRAEATSGSFMLEFLSGGDMVARPILNGREVYRRIFIRRRVA